MSEEPQARFKGNNGFSREFGRLMAHISDGVLRRRAEIMGMQGTTFGGERKLYEVFGWPLTPTYNTYAHMYRRGGIAKRIIDAYPRATWREPPNIKDKSEDSEETAFEKAWKGLENRRRVLHYLERADRMATLGTYSVLFMGWNDVADYEALTDPVGALRGKEPWEKLLYLQPFPETLATVQQWDEDPKSERFGKPLVYQLQLLRPSMGGISGVQRTVLVHHTRILHVAEDVLESDLEGAPKLEAVLNMLLDLEKTLGAAAESFFQQWPPGITMTSQKDAHLDQTEYQDGGAGYEAIQDFIHGFKRWMVMNGIDINTIQPQLGDPSPISDALIELIAGTVGIPKRILVGSERGELSSEQDETNWNQRVSERQQQWAEPFLLRPLLEAMVAKGVLPQPQGEELIVEWKGTRSLSEVVLADIAIKKTEAIAKYAGTSGTTEIVPEEVFLDAILGLGPEVVDRIKEVRQELWDKEAENMLETAENPPVPPGQVPGEEPNQEPGKEEEEPTTNYDPHQPRDKEGQWSSGGGGGYAAESREKGEKIKTYNTLAEEMAKNTDSHIDVQRVKRELSEASQYWVERKVPLAGLKGLHDTDVDPKRAVVAKGAVIVKPDGYIIDGRHRAAAAKAAGETHIQAWIALTEKPKTKANERLADNYDPHQPRDKEGQWTDGPGGGGGSGGGGEVTRGEGGQWLDSSGKPLSKEDQDRLRKVPKAWTNVTLNPDRNADLQVMGRDSKGRVQAIYSAAHMERASAEKFQRGEQFSRVVDKAQRTALADMDKGNDTAACLYLISRTGFRVGSTEDTKADKQAYGASTLNASHVSIKGDTITFSFTGKKGVAINQTLKDSALAKYLAPKVAAGGPLFNTTNAKVLAYTKKVTGDSSFKTKDFRTHVATAVALQAMKEVNTPTNHKERQSATIKVAKAVAKQLGNTPTVALKYYINPKVFSAWENI